MDSGGQITDATLQFSTSSSGSYSAVHPGGPGSQTGTFTVETIDSNPNADFTPDSLRGRNVRVTIERGSGPFAPAGSYLFQASNNSNNYTIASTSIFVDDSFGTYSYSQNSRTRAVINAQDSEIPAPVISEIEFYNSQGGRLVNRVQGLSGSQSGAFILE